MLNPSTGTETEQDWPGAEPQVPPPPRLDLEGMWQDVAQDVRIPTAEGDIAVPSVLDVAE